MIAQKISLMFVTIVTFVVLYVSFYGLRRYTPVFDGVLGEFTFWPMHHDPETWLSPLTGPIERAILSPARSFDAQIRFKIASAEKDDQKQKSRFWFIHYEVGNLTVGEIHPSSHGPALHDDLVENGVTFQSGAAFEYHNGRLSMWNTVTNHRKLQAYLQTRAPQRWKIVGHTPN